MYFWRIDALKQYLTDHGQTDQQTFPYLLYSLSAAAAILALVWLLPAQQNHWRYLQSIAGVVVSVLGVHWVYRCNGGDKGSEFLSRFISLFWVCLLRGCAGFVVLALVLLGVRLIWPDRLWFDALATGCFIIGYGALYAYLGKQIHAVAAVRGELP